MKCVVRFAEIDPARVLNLTSPRYLPEIALQWHGQFSWHAAKYEPLRDMIEAVYIDRFNRANGHFERLLANIAYAGIKNPVMLTAGHLVKRKIHEIPPAWAGCRPLIVSEYLGGSRLWAAAKLGIKAPAIVNDFQCALPDACPLTGLPAILARFSDPPAEAKLRSDGAVIVGDLPFIHLPAEKRISLDQQICIRRRIVAEIRALVADWLREKEGLKK